MPTRRIITLLTDFGSEDSYVAQVKGVILSHCRQVDLIDISHEIKPYDVLGAARLLREVVPQFPTETIHLAVVDPGVGTTRKRIIVEAFVQDIFTDRKKRCFFVGPDNGLFSLVVPKSERIGVWEISSLDALPKQRSATTFDGRNIFAPVSALLAAGKKPSDFGPLIESFASGVGIVETPWVVEPVVADGRIRGEIVRFDHFGNAVTNIQVSSSLREVALATVSPVKGEPFVATPVTSYSAIGAERAGCIINSQGYLEIALNQRSAENCLKLVLGDTVELVI